MNTNYGSTVDRAFHIIHSTTRYPVYGVNFYNKPTVYFVERLYISAKVKRYYSFPCFYCLISFEDIYVECKHYRKFVSQYSAAEDTDV